MILKKLVVATLLLFSFCQLALAEYEIKGKVNLSSDWQQQIFLATINKLDDYHNANPEDIVQATFINDDGSFTLSGDNLPLESRYYRLYLIKEENSEFNACLYVGGDDHNFLHLIMDNSTQIEINADPNYNAPFGNYQVIGNRTNDLMRQLNRIIHPSYYFYQIKFPSELQFSQKKLNRDLFHFADTSSNTLVSLAAIINTDFDSYFEADENKYIDFGERLKASLSDHSYTRDYFRKLSYYKDDSLESSFPKWFIFLAILLGLSCLGLFIKNRSLRKEIEQLKSATVPTVVQETQPSFTNQEEKILSLIIDGKTNKEIAADLFIELSTVKTHINKLYSKLGVKTRKEAKTKAISLIKRGV